MVRALLVDDEQPARERLRRLLAAFDEVEVEVQGIGTLRNGIEDEVV